MRWVRVAAFVGAVVTVTGEAGPAFAGPWFEARAGAGILSGHFEFEKQYTGFDPEIAPGQVAVAHDEGGPVGVAIGLGGLVGWSFGRTFALGLSGRVELAPYLVSARPRYAGVDGHTLAALGPALALRPARSLELRLTGEWVPGAFWGYVLEIGEDDNVFEFENVSGPGVALSLGYVSEPGWGFAAVGHVAVLSSEHIDFVPVTFSLVASWSSW